MFFRRIGMAIARFMQGRYGVDALGFVTVGAYILLSLCFNFVRSFWLYLPMALLFFVFLFRALSKNQLKRRHENEVFLHLTRGIRTWFTNASRRTRDRKTHLYFRCPACHNTLRVPRGKGSITVTCPVCKEQIRKRT